ncbi:MAG: Stk1 family PASTA domain-containing Ser/Thr kinase [Bacilli bacterium]
MIIKGQKINDRYEIIRSIGEGGMANVYLAQDTILDRKVAVKILRGDLANDEKFVRRFQREAISASSLVHPNIVEMYDVGEDDGKYFIVMEYVEGKTLKNLIKKRGVLTLPEVIDIILQLTNGLACAHDSYIIHRDIKPQNVLILDDGRVKITDFGIAMALNSNELTQTNSVMGSVHYLPPEQANGSGSTIKSDIYSLGILMYELLTGKLPFKGENAVEIAIKHMKDPIPSVCEFNESIPQSIENIILKATAKNPKNRFESVVEMNQNIKTALDVARAKENKLIFEYSETDPDDKSPLGLTRTKKNQNAKEIDKEKKKDKVANIAIIVLSALFGIMVIAIIFVMFILPKVSAVPDVEIPDVSNMSVEDAEITLEKLGFIISTDTQQIYSETIEEGSVISTSPSNGKFVKKGSIITLKVSVGTEGISLENYVGKDYNIVLEQLEKEGIIVSSKNKEVSEAEALEENIIIEQSIAEGNKLISGDSIEFTIVKIITVYPNFVTEDWSVNGVQDFCDKNGISLEVTYNESTTVAENTIMTQSRVAGSKVVSGVTLRITVSKKVVEETEKDSSSSTSSSTTTSG